MSVARIAVVLGHPDASRSHFGHALADAYRTGAEEAGHEIRVIDVGKIEFPMLRLASDFGREPAGPIHDAQETIRWASHLVFVYPLWLGGMPALFKGFLEQLCRAGFARASVNGKMGKPQLTGRTARIVVTMGMPALVYRVYFGGHDVKTFKRNILGFAGIRPIHSSFIGGVDGSPRRRQRWLDRMRTLGRQAG